VAQADAAQGVDENISHGREPQARASLGMG
jgi:hypothetical protein